jgi:two-component system chemotaxis sensor kinase CheA
VALTTVLVLSVFSFVMFAHLTNRERTRRIQAKVDTAVTLAELYAGLMAAPLEFEDTDAARSELESLAASPDVAGVDVWTAAGTAPLVHAGRATATTVRAEQSSLEVTDTDVLVTRVVTGMNGARLGALNLTYSLATENEAAERSRRELLLATLFEALVVSLVLILIARKEVIRPLGRLVAAAKAVSDGDFSVRVPSTQQDEIGALSRAYNNMAESLVDRDRLLAEVTNHIRDLFDHMGQGLLSFDKDGIVRGAVSREAKVMFQRDSLEGEHLRDLLYPGRSTSDVDVVALDDWLALAFEIDPERFAECEAYAPREIFLRSGKTTLALELTFRPIVRDDEKTMLLLARDITREHSLEVMVRTQEQEHVARLAAMRRLLAGGSQVVVSFMVTARERLTRVRSLVTPVDGRIALVAIAEAFQIAHVIKGEARAMEFDDLENCMHELEDAFGHMHGATTHEGYAATAEEVTVLTEGVDVALQALETGANLLAEVSPVGKAIFDQVNVSRGDLDELGTLLRTDAPKSAIEAVHARLVARPFGELVMRSTDSAGTWAAEEGKRIELVLNGRETRIPERLAPMVTTFVTQAIRNAIAHGIERPEARQAEGKAAAGTVTVTARASGHGIEVIVEDDGHGLDLETLRARGGPSASIAPPAELVFRPGLSSREEAGRLAGRGMGMPAVLSVARALGYDIAVEYQAGRFTRFRLFEPSNGEG